MEEIASAVNAQAADDNQICTSVGPTIAEYYGMLVPWIDHYRIKHSRPRAWSEIEHLTARWKKLNRC
jgi:hypothetical protein